MGRGPIVFLCGQVKIGDWPISLAEQLAAKKKGGLKQVDTNTIPEPKHSDMNDGSLFGAIHGAMEMRSLARGANTESAVLSTYWHDDDF